MPRLATLALLMFLSLGAGCAPATSDRALQVSDVKSLSGKWLGYATGTGAGAPNPIELIISPDGTWSSRMGAQLQTGKVSLDDGKISFARGAAWIPATVFQRPRRFRSGGSACRRAGRRSWALLVRVHDETAGRRNRATGTRRKDRTGPTSLTPSPSPDLVPDSS
jgi:hypothetical protein